MGPRGQKGDRGEPGEKGREGSQVILLKLQFNSLTLEVSPMDRK